MTETDLVREIIAFVKASGGDAWHVHGSSVQRAGEPDIDGWVPVGNGIVHFKAECKLEKGVVSPLQTHRLARYRKVGYAAGVVRSVADWEKLVLDAYTRGAYV